MPQNITLKKLSAVLITPENFQPYGQLITPSPDGKAFDETDAVLNLKNGIPRFYIMRLEHRGRTFNKITRHNFCTQCLGSLNGKDWFMAVCPPSANDEPDISQLRAFRIPGNCFIKLEVGTWHAGPYFDHHVVDFYNLELSDTNVVDHFTHNFSTKQNIEWEIIN
ncbi:MAG: ureidoglycolate lyase [Pleurocapsa sp. MO_192.B19]|nr:ureidoglycolate lyase [Pleurocapsa sp. MO_192.B19]